MVIRPPVEIRPPVGKIAPEPRRRNPTETVSMYRHSCYISASKELGEGGKEVDGIYMYININIKEGMKLMGEGGEEREE